VIIRAKKHCPNCGCRIFATDIRDFEGAIEMTDEEEMRGTQGILYCSRCLMQYKVNAKRRDYPCGDIGDETPSAICNSGWSIRPQGMTGRSIKQYTRKIGMRRR